MATDLIVNLTPNSDGSINPLYRTGLKSIASGVTGAISKGSTVTIIGSGFGAGPTVSLYDPADKVIGEMQKLTDPEIGDYYGVNSYYEAGGKDGGSCLRAIDLTGSENPFFHLFHGVITETTEVFVSYNYKHVLGSYFPSPFVSAPDIYPDIQSDSCLKPSWLMWSDNGNNYENDTIFMEHSAGGGQWSLSGNDRNIQMGVGGISPSWFVFGNWIRKTLYIKADAANPSTANGTHYMHFLNQNDPAFVYEKNDVPTFDVDKVGTEPYAWDRIKFVPWARGGAPGTVKHQIDDIYVAAGANAAARVELGNAASYAACTELAICPTTAWDDGEITTTIHPSAINLASDVWLYVTLADNVTRQSWKVL